MVQRLDYLPPARVKAAPADAARETDAGEDEEDDHGHHAAHHGQQGEAALLLPVREVRGETVGVATESLCYLLPAEHP